VTLAQTAGTAAAAFAATNVDDIVVLAVLFASRDDRLRGRQIVAGQALGITVLVVAALAVGAGLLALADRWVGLLGLIPIAFGVRGLRALRAGRDADEPPPLTVGALGVASITVANGGDNVAIYAPLFATMGADAFATTIAVFAVGVAVWCAAGRVIGSHPAVMRTVARTGRVAVPLVLIALGAFIVLESGLL
jgi:cadmium resistance protein CadD (predicted permease)